MRNEALTVNIFGHDKTEWSMFFVCAFYSSVEVHVELSLFAVTKMNMKRALLIAVIQVFVVQSLSGQPQYPLF